MSDGQIATGTTISMDGGLIAELSNIDGLDLQVKEVDFSSHDNSWDEFKAGRKSVGDVALEGNFVPSDTDGQAAMYAALVAGTVHEFVITAPDSSWTWAFDGFVKQFKTSEPDDDKVGFTASIKVTGQPALAIGASDDLSGLVPSVGTLTGPLTASVYEYVVPVITGTTGLTITPTGSGTIQVNGTTVASGAASGTVALGAAGSVTEILVTVQESGKVKKTYTLWVARAAS